jgi:hypothetical protein
MADKDFPRDKDAREARLEKLGRRLQDLEAFMKKAEGGPGVPGDDEALRKAEELLGLDDEFLVQFEKTVEEFHDKYGDGDEPKPTETAPGSAS